MEPYFGILKKTGYVRDSTVFRFLLYLFLYDFVDTVYDYMTVEDYDLVNSVLSGIFSGGGCLLPYETFGNCRIKVGNNKYNARFVHRITEDDSDNLDRITEDGEQRAI